MEHIKAEGFGMIHKVYPITAGDSWGQELGEACHSMFTGRKQRQMNAYTVFFFVSVQDLSP